MKNQEVIDAMKLLVHGFYDLTQLLDTREDGDTLLTENYPFEQCFRDMTVKVEKWLETTEGKFKTKKQWVTPTITLSKTPDISDTLPQVVKCEFVNTGGGTMVSIIDVINCGAVKQLMMNEEGISANSFRYEDCDESIDPEFVFDKYSALRDKFGEMLADQVMNELKRYCHKYNVHSEIGDGKWQEDFEELKMRILAGSTYQQEVAKYITHLREVSEDLLETLDTTGYIDKVHDITITLDGKSLVVPMNADSYLRMRKFLQEEYDEG